MRVLELFSGMGGFSEGFRSLGIATHGKEIWRPAVETARANGHDVDEVDVSTDYPNSHENGIVAGPPCTPFSPAGKGLGRLDLPQLYVTADRMAHSDDFDIKDELAAFRQNAHDPQSALALEPWRWFLLIRPDWMILEQSDRVLPLWQHFASLSGTIGYNAVALKVDAHHYGVPQSPRRRAILLVHKSRLADDLVPEPALPFPAMHDVLDLCPETYLRSNYGTGGDSKRRGVRWASQPSFTVTSKYNRNRFINHEHGTDVAVTDAQALALQTFRPDYKLVGKPTEIQQMIGNAVPPALARRLAERVL